MTMSVIESKKNESDHLNLVPSQSPLAQTLPSVSALGLL